MSGLTKVQLEQTLEQQRTLIGQLRVQREHDELLITNLRKAAVDAHASAHVKIVELEKQLEAARSGWRNAEARTGELEEQNHELTRRLEGENHELAKASSILREQLAKAYADRDDALADARGLRQANADLARGRAQREQTLNHLSSEFEQQRRAYLEATSKIQELQRKLDQQPPWPAPQGGVTMSGGEGIAAGTLHINAEGIRYESDQVVQLQAQLEDVRNIADAWRHIAGSLLTILKRMEACQ